MTLLHLVRHGRHTIQGLVMVGRAADIHLAPEGRAEAERAAEWLARSGLDALYCSPLERARETAEPIARLTGLEPEIVDAATEVDYGEWTGFTLEQLQPDPLWRAWNQVRGFARAPNGETLAEVQARAVGLVVALRERHPEQRVALVSHGDTIKSVLAQALGIPLEFFLRLGVSPGSISSIQFFPSDLRVLRVNFLPEPPG